jgi:glycine/D-amino acid oxidase-like deaminating enzyme
MRRRDFIRSVGAGAGALAVPSAFSAETLTTSPTTPPTALIEPFILPKVRADVDRIVAVTVCTRPFRAKGARIEAEKLGRKTVVHNYGHGGSGWSLSWGSSTLAVRLALQTKAKEIAVIGCGALGLTSALVAQRAGLKVKIYAKERPPEVRSTFATGSWTPNSRYCSEEHTTAELAAQWEEMTRISHRTFQHMLSLPGEPIEWREGYLLTDWAPGAGPKHTNEPIYPDLDARVRDLTPRNRFLTPGTHPFPTAYVRRFTTMNFNITVLQRQLMQDFLLAGGVIETREFASPSDVAKLKEKTLINATGYGARALWGDESIVPVRGQLLRLIPQPEIAYGLMYNGVLSMVPRRDGIVLQTQKPDDFGNADATVDRAQAEQAVTMMAELNSRILGS